MSRETDRLKEKDQDFKIKIDKIREARKEQLRHQAQLSSSKRGKVKDYLNKSHRDEAIVSKLNLKALGERLEKGTDRADKVVQRK